MKAIPVIFSIITAIIAVQMNFSVIIVEGGSGKNGSTIAVSDFQWQRKKICFENHLDVREVSTTLCVCRKYWSTGRKVQVVRHKPETNNNLTTCVLASTFLFAWRNTKRESSISFICVSGHQRLVSCHTFCNTFGAGTDDMEKVDQSFIWNQSCALRFSIWNGEHQNYQQTCCEYCFSVLQTMNEHTEAKEHEQLWEKKPYFVLADSSHDKGRDADVGHNTYWSWNALLQPVL